MAKRRRRRRLQKQQDEDAYRLNDKKLLKQYTKSIQNINQVAKKTAKKTKTLIYDISHGLSRTVNGFMKQIGIIYQKMMMIMYMTGDSHKIKEEEIRKDLSDDDNSSSNRNRNYKKGEKRE